MPEVFFGCEHKEIHDPARKLHIGYSGGFIPLQRKLTIAESTRCCRLVDYGFSGWERFAQ